MTYDYSDECISDFHKEVYGYRPTHDYMVEWNSSSPTQKQKVWDEYARINEININKAKAKETIAIVQFNKRIKEIMYFGAGDRETALRWISQSEKFSDEQDVEHFVWKQGILFTDYGKKLLKDFLSIVKFERSKTCHL